MVERRTNNTNSRTRASPGSESNLRKLTQSCSRCRASKLKCDRKEPCLECVKRNLSHLCTKDERQPRAKRAKTAHNSNCTNNPKRNASRNGETDAEVTAQVLEHFVEGMSGINATVLQPTPSSIAPDYINTYWSTTNNPHKEGEKLALVREIIDAIPEPEMIYQLYEVFTTRSQGPLGNIVHTPTVMTQVEKLCSCLRLTLPEEQVMALSNSFSMDSLACHLLALTLALSFHPTPSILGWSSTPLSLRVEELRASEAYPKMWRSLALRCLQGGVSLFCGSIASLQVAIMLLVDGQEGSLALDALLVTAISGAQKLCLHRLGDARLEISASLTSPCEDDFMASTEQPHIRTEIGIRIWWALVMRDWSRAQALGYYSIHPSHFNTRMPLHINDDDLCASNLVNGDGHITERPRSEFTTLSYTVHALEIAILVRESVDLRGPPDREQRQEEMTGCAKIRTHLNNKYEKFVAGLPSYFRLGSIMGLTSTGPMAAIPVQRWMLHQQLWSLFLKFHRSNLSSRDSRASCQLLAQNIISTQAQIQARCAVCRSLSTNDIQLFSAAVALLIDSLYSCRHNDDDQSGVQLGRIMARDKTREAIELLRTQSETEGSSCPQGPQSDQVKVTVRRSVIVLEALMKLDKESDNTERNSRADSTENCPGGNAAKSDGRFRQTIKEKVMDILTALQGDANNAIAQGNVNSVSALDMTVPLHTATVSLQDLDVLPMLSNDPSCNFLQFLNFAPLDPSAMGDSLDTADLQAYVDLMPFTPSSSEVHSLSSFSTSKYADR